MKIMKIAKLILLLALVEHCFGVPMRFDFTCSEVQIGKKKFEQFIDVVNTSDINVVLHRTLQYFNVSLLYKDVLMERINTYCFSIKS